MQDIAQSSHINMMPNMSQTRSDMQMFGNPNMFHAQQQNFGNHPQMLSRQQQDGNNQFQSYNLPPPNFSIPDLSRPPPSFALATEAPAPQVEQVEEPEPKPFFLLPAGLMVPQICLEDCNYKSLDPSKIKPLPALPPSEKLLKAIEAFYAPPSHERPRDAEGWEKLGLYEYFKLKNAARKQKEDAIARGDRQKSKSPSPIPSNYSKPVKKTKKRAYHSKSPEIRVPRSKSRSMSPAEVRPALSIRSRSRKRSPSPTSYRPFKREARIERRKRSVTPPSFMGASPKAATEFISEGNKGHQMMKKLGWTGGGLGTAKNQGIIEPISGGEVRERNEIYKVRLVTWLHPKSWLKLYFPSQGVGMVADPYESFRQNRSKNFTVRMKARGDDKI